MKFALLLCSVFVIGFSAAAAPAQTAPVTPVAVAAPVPAPTATPEPTVPVAVIAAPPQWAQNLLVTAEKLPTIGPIVSKALVYMGILVSILTAGVGFLMALLSALSGIAGLSDQLLLLLRDRLNLFFNFCVLIGSLFFKKLNFIAGYL